MAWLSGFFGLLAAVLVIIGLYGLVSYMTLTRRNKLGIRLALGARRDHILWLVLRQGLKSAGIGVASATFDIVGLPPLKIEPGATLNNAKAD